MYTILGVGSAVVYIRYSVRVKDIELASKQQTYTSRFTHSEMKHSKINIETLEQKKSKSGGPKELVIFVALQVVLTHTFSSSCTSCQ